MSFVAWIPILTPEINFKRRVDAFLRKNHLQFQGDVITYKREFDDEAKNREKDKKVKLYFNEKKSKIEKIDFENVSVAEIIDITKEGIVFFKVISNVKDKQKLAEQIFIVVKDVYHEHTHHHHEDDMLLRPVETEEGKYKINDIVAKKILNQYTEKIIHYHKKLNEYIDERQIMRASKMKGLLLLFKKSIGEMIYALHFISLVKPHISSELYDSHKKSYESALTSIRNLRDNFPLHQNQLNINLFVLSILITVLGLIISKVLGIIIFVILVVFYLYYIIDWFHFKKITCTLMKQILTKYIMGQANNA